MVEVSPNTPEKQFSAEQEQLLKTAYELLALPQTETNGPYPKYRRTTRTEKIQKVLGRVTGKRGSTKISAGDFSKRIASERTTRRVPIRGLLTTDGPGGSWGGGVYLRQEEIKDFDRGTTTTESLVLYASATVDSGGTGLAAYKDEKLWQVDLLEPIGDVLRIKELQGELDKAAVELHEAAERHGHES